MFLLMKGEPTKMKIKNIKEKIFYAIAIGVSIFFLFFFIGASWISYEVKDQCQEAKREYGGDCVESLISLLDDESKGFRARNNAIWSLGQLGDGRALPVLQNYYTGIIPEREPLDKSISQYELKKAINLTSGGPNIIAWIWRNGLKNYW
jgi:hypothetical protein